jgi:oligopeptide transport system substrate-binding protein
MLLVACGERGQDFGQPREKRKQPVDLVLVDGRPDPAVLADEQVLYRGNAEEPQTLDPHLAEGVPSSTILRDLFEGLTTLSVEADVIPGAAARWNISRDAKTYTFYLRRDAVWSNGDPVTAQDFVYSLRRSADPETAGPHANMLLPILNAREVLAGEKPVEELGISLLDEYTLQITLTGPTPYFLGMLTHPATFPVHRPSIEEHGNQYSRPGKLVSNGAYILKDWQLRTHIEIEKNPNYREAANTLLERVFYMPVEDISTEVKQFRAGELDWTYEVPNNQFRWLQEHYADELVVSTWLGSYFFGFNLTAEPFIDNLNLRMALNLAIDRAILTSKVTQFGERPSFALVPPGIGDYEPAVPEFASWTQQERNEEARALYEMAGYSEANPLHVEIRYNTSENHKKIALAIASMWKQELGVSATLVNEEFKVFLQNRQQKVITQVFRAGWISDYNDAYSFLDMFRSGHIRNDFGYANESFDAILDEVAKERIQARRDRMMHAAERMLLADTPIIPIYTYVTKRLVDRHLQGWKNNVMDQHYSRYMFKLKSRDRAQAAPADSAGNDEEAARPQPAMTDPEASDRTEGDTQ